MCGLENIKIIVQLQEIFFPSLYALYCIKKACTTSINGGIKTINNY